MTVSSVNIEERIVYENKTGKKDRERDLSVIQRNEHVNKKRRSCRAVVCRWPRVYERFAQPLLKS